MAHQVTQVISLELDQLPVSINDLWMPARGKLITTPKYRAWKEWASWEIKRQSRGSLEGNYALHVQLSAPDNRARDLDNFAFKALSDAAQMAGAIRNDNKCARLKAKWTNDGPALRAWFIATSGDDDDA